VQVGEPKRRRGQIRLNRGYATWQHPIGSCQHGHDTWHVPISPPHQGEPHHYMELTNWLHQCATWQTTTRPCHTARATWKFLNGPHQQSNYSNQTHVYQSCHMTDGY
jgi:hypothetical protein